MPIREFQFKKYKSYKNSDIEWVGDIPSHWGVSPGFTVVQERKEKNIGMKENTVLSLSYGKVIIKPEEKLTGLVPESFETYQLVYPGDIIVRPTDLQNDKTSLRIGLSTEKGIITSAYINLSVLAKNVPKFYFYFLYTVDITKVIYGMGSGLRQNLSFIDFRRFKFLCPPHDEQIAIANFLDTKSELIDKAIAIKEKQIELLKERRQILIHRAVTRGLNPNVKMKESGVEWIGKVPEHWEVKRLKYVVEILKRIIGFEGPDVLSITQKGIKVKDIESGEGQLAMDYSKYQKIFKGEFAMNHMDLLTGYVDISKYDGVISPDYRVFISRYSNLHDPFLLLIFQVCYKSRIFYKYGQGVSQLGRWRFPSENFNNFTIPIPSMEEQMMISNYIESIDSKISSSISLKQMEVKKLLEYKFSLINDTVTGKIKVV